MPEITTNLQPPSFQCIYATAEDRKGGPDKITLLLRPIQSPDILGKQPDRYYLSMMAKAVMQAGFSWKTVHKKWPEMEAAFLGFDIEKLGYLPEERWEALLNDKRVIRSWTKIKAIQQNLAFVRDTAEQHGSFGRFIADWPTADQVGLMAHLKTHGHRLGGTTGQWFMRYIGRDCFVLTPDVIRALRQAGFDLPQHPTAKRDLNKIQACFNSWHQETQLPYTHLSQILAYSTGENLSTDRLWQEINFGRDL